jgi:hypothetical protein
VLTEGHIAESAAFLELLLARSPTLDERAFLREQEIKEFGEDLENWRKGLDYLRGLMAEYRGKGQLFFLKEDIRLKQFRGMYCYFKQATKPYHAEFVTMLQKAHDIVYENCEQQVVSTERAVDGYVATLNFVAFLADVPLLSDEEEATIRNDVKHWQLGSEAGLASLVQWWSWLSPEKKEQELAKIRNKGLRRATDVADNLNAYTDVAGVSLVLMEAKMNSCQVLAVIEQGTAKLHIAEAGPKFGRELDWNPLGVNVGRLSQLQSLGTFYSAFCT